MDSGSSQAHADEQPRPERRRKAGRADRVRRTRQGGAQLGVLSHHHRNAGPAGKRPDPAGAVWKSSRRSQHASPRAARAHCQLEPGASLGELGRVRQTGCCRADDVRPDDSRLMDLHWHAGDIAGHVRNISRRCEEVLQRHARRHHHRDSRPRRHGWSAASRDKLAGGACICVEVDPTAYQTPAGDALSRQGDGLARRSDPMARTATQNREAVSIGLLGMLRRCFRRW